MTRSGAPAATLTTTTMHQAIDDYDAQRQSEQLAEQLEVVRFTATGRIEFPPRMLPLYDPFDRAQALYQKWPRRTITAIHEAGHIFAALAFGRPVTGFSVDDEDGGRTIFNHAEHYRAKRAGREAEEMEIETRMVIVAAGGEAVRLLAPEDDPGDGDGREGDLCELKQMARSLVGLDPLPVGFAIERAQLRAARLVEENWQAVLLVALALLDYHDAVSTFRAAKPVTLAALDPYGDFVAKRRESSPEPIEATA